MMLLANERQWLGELAQHLFEPGVPLFREEHGLVNLWYWSRGWLDEVNFWQVSRDGLKALARAPAARLLRHLGIVNRYEEGYLNALAEAPFLTNLRRFRLGEEVDYERGRYNCTTFGEGLVPVLAGVRRLEELHLLAHNLDLRELLALPNFTSLRTLVIYHERGVYPLDVLADNPAFSSLETLRLHPGHTDDADSYLPFDEVAALFHSPHLQSLKHLHLHASGMGDEGCEELVDSGILERLETLDLSFGRITDAGVNTLLGSPHIGRLNVLSLANNQISDEGIDQLLALGIPEFRHSGQGEEGEDSYLYSGDME